MAGSGKIPMAATAASGQTAPSGAAYSPGVDGFNEGAVWLGRVVVGGAADAGGAVVVGAPAIVVEIVSAAGVDVAGVLTVAGAAAGPRPRSSSRRLATRSAPTPNRITAQVPVAATRLATRWRRRRSI